MHPSAWPGTFTTGPIVYTRRCASRCSFRSFSLRLHNEPRRVLETRLETARAPVHWILAADPHQRSQAAGLVLSAEDIICGTVLR